MFDLLRRWLRPRPRLTTVRPVARSRQGAVVTTHTGLAVHVTLFGGGAPAVPRAPSPKPARRDRPTPILDALFGKKVPPLTDAQARQLPLVKPPADTLAAAQALTGERYPGRTAIQAARAAAQERAVAGAARVVAPRLAKTPAIQAPGKKPIRVKAHVRADGTRVHAHTRVRPGEGTK